MERDDATDGGGRGKRKGGQDGWWTTAEVQHLNSSELLTADETNISPDRFVFSAWLFISSHPTHNPLPSGSVEVVGSDGGHISKERHRRSARRLTSSGVAAAGQTQWRTHRCLSAITKTSVSSRVQLHHMWPLNSPQQHRVQGAAGHCTQHVTHQTVRRNAFIYTSKTHWMISNKMKWLNINESKSYIKML